jgi:hypothetical protein
MKILEDMMATGCVDGRNLLLLHREGDFDGVRDYPPFREFVRPKG